MFTYSVCITAILTYGFAKCGIHYKFAESNKKKMMAVYENAEYKSETDIEKRDNRYEELEQNEGNTEQDKVYTELK